MNAGGQVEIPVYAAAHFVTMRKTEQQLPSDNAQYNFGYGRCSPAQISGGVGRWKKGAEGRVSPDEPLQIA